MSTPVRKTTTLTNGVEMPMVGFGVYQNPRSRPPTRSPQL